jgi:O-antigen ligase
MVFMAHGLAVSMFMCAACMCCVMLGRHRQKITPFKISAKAVSWFLFLILIACKSTGGILYGLIFVPMVAKLKPKNIVRVAVVIALFVTIYPTLRATRVFPAQQFVALSKDVFGEERAQSMAFRFENEELLLDKAFTRMWFGWGGEGRGRVYDEEMGKEITIADGWWIIVLSQRGAIGAICNFAVLLIPIFAMRKRIRKIKDKREAEMIAGLTLVGAVYVLDLVPNGAFSVIPYLLAGALYSISNEMVKGTASIPPQVLPQAVRAPQVDRRVAAVPTLRR